MQTPARTFTPAHLLKLQPLPCGLLRPRHGFSRSSLAVLISGVCGTLPKIYSSLARDEVAFCLFSEVVSALKTKAKNKKPLKLLPVTSAPGSWAHALSLPAAQAPPHAPGMGQGTLSPGGGTPPALSLLHPGWSDTCLEIGRAHV